VKEASVDFFFIFVPLIARGNPLYGVPERLQLEVAAANARLEEQR
jgi:hypothetical protein